MVKRYFNLLKNIICSIGITKRSKTNGVYDIRTLQGGRLHKIIGINNVMQVKKLSVTGKINVTDLYFILHMDNLEILDLKNAIYLRKEQNEAEKNRLRRDLVKKKKHLKEISFPSSMKSVPSGLFRNCMELEHVILPNSVKTICSHAFSNSGIREVSIPTSVNTIKPCAFDNCKNLERVKIEDSKNLLKWKGEHFKNCPSLREIYLGRNSPFEYTLITGAPLNKLVLGKDINNLNFDIHNTNELVCLMKHPPHLPNTIAAQNIYIKHNFELYWLHPEWNKRNLIAMKDLQDGQNAALSPTSSKNTY